MRRVFTALLATALLAVPLAVPATADSERVTYGDVVAHHQATEGGGAVAFQTGKPGAMASAPADLFRHSMRPFAGTPYENNHYCELDWLLVATAFFGSVEDTGLPSLQAVRKVLLDSSAEFKVDGSTVGPVQATAVKRFLATFTDLGGPGVWRNWGVFYAPGELSVGKHTLATIGDIPSFPPEFTIGPVDFYVDAAGSGACL